MDRYIITIDGLASSGKTTLARELAKRLGYAHLNSGILYRAVGYLALEEGVSPDDGLELGAVISRHSIRLELDSERSSVLLIDDKVYGEELQEPRVSEATSKAASLPEVRSALVESQRHAFSPHDLIAEGRDMGTIIFPDAALKFFIEADVAVRADRRLEQLLAGAGASSKDPNLLKEQLEIEIGERDKRDSERELAPTKPASDAVTINNSGQTLTQVIQNMYDSVANRGLVRTTSVS